jgi:3'-5' exoribonuclease
MARIKNTFVRDLKPGEAVADVFLVIEARLGQARNGPFWSLTLGDATGRAGAKVWSPLSREYTEFAPGQAVYLEGPVQTFREQIQVIVERLELLDLEQEGLELSLFLPASEERPRDMLAGLMELCRTHLVYPPWRSLALEILEDPEVQARMLAAPGAKSVHHAYGGGLLEHTLSVARLCMRMCEQYPRLDRETLLVAAVFHDLGKGWELSGGLANDYTDEGRLLGHIFIGLGVLEPFFARSGVAGELLLHLRHIILSHHGQYEYGSPRRPKTAEALALHYADNLDAKLNQVAGVFEGVDEEETGVWSPYQRTLERFIYKPAVTPTATPTATTTTAPAIDGEYEQPREAGHPDAPCTEFTGDFSGESSGDFSGDFSGESPCEPPCDPPCELPKELQPKELQEDQCSLPLKA